MEYLTKRLSDEERKYWEEQLAKAVPYTQEESDAIPFDSDPDDYDWDRESALMAQKILAEDDELKARGL